MAGPRARRSDAAPAPVDLLAHGGAPRLEGGGQPLRLLLEVSPAAVEQVAGPGLRVARRLLRPAEELPTSLGEELPGFLAGPRGHQQSGDRAGDGAEEEPSEIRPC